MKASSQTTYTDTTCDTLETCMWCTTYNQYDYHTDTQDVGENCFSAVNSRHTNCAPSVCNRC